MSQYTPGPWRRQGAIIWGARGRKVAHVETVTGEPLEDNANARLIARAPLLFECSSRLVEVLLAQDKIMNALDRKTVDAVLELQAAVTKAEGWDI